MHFRADQKLFLSYLAVVTAVVVALTVGVGSMLRRQLTGIVADDLRRELYLARTIDEQSGAAHPDSVADFLGQVSGRRITIIAPDGRVLGASERDGDERRGMENPLARPEVREALEGHLGRSVRVSSSVGSEYLYLAIPTSTGRVMRASVPLREVNRAVALLQRGSVGGDVLARR